MSLPFVLTHAGITWCSSSAVEGPKKKTHHHQTPQTHPNQSLPVFALSPMISYTSFIFPIFFQVFWILFLTDHVHHFMTSLFQWIRWTAWVPADNLPPLWTMTTHCFLLFIFSYYLFLCKDLLLHHKATVVFQSPSWGTLPNVCWKHRLYQHGPSLFAISSSTNSFESHNLPLKQANKKNLILHLYVIFNNVFSNSIPYYTFY